MPDFTTFLCGRPFLLQAKASYTQIGIFSLASYPYSFKLFWSPVVDSMYSLAFGRRKSWIVRTRSPPPPPSQLQKGLPRMSG